MQDVDDVPDFAKQQAAAASAGAGGDAAVPGSSPNWLAANFKTKGRARPTAAPAATLAEGGWACWTQAVDPRAGRGRRHFHAPSSSSLMGHDEGCSSVPGRTADCAAAATSSPSTPAALLCRSGKQLHHQLCRHRKAIATPPPQQRPQGKRMVPTAADPAAASAVWLFRDPLSNAPADDRRHDAAPNRPAAAHSRCNVASTLCSGGGDSVISCDCGHEPQQQQRQQGTCSPAAQCKGAAGAAAACAARTAEQQQAAGSPAAEAGQLLPTGQQIAASAAEPTATAAGSLLVGHTGVAPRVQDDPNYFRTLKEPPSFVRFCASLKPAQPAATAAQVHERLLRAHRAAEAEAARAEVAALRRPGCMPGEDED